VIAALRGACPASWQDVDVIEPLQIGIVVACLLLALATLWLVVRDERPNDPLALGLAVVEVALLVQLVAGIVLLTRSDGDVSGVTFVGYLVGVLLVLPAGLLWSLGEKSRSGTAVLLVALLVVAFLEVRLGQIWAAGA
jgi:hypothetical protein